MILGRGEWQSDLNAAKVLLLLIALRRRHGRLATHSPPVQPAGSISTRYTAAIAGLNVIGSA